MKARDIMTTTVITVPPDASIALAVELMLTHHVSALPVVDAGGAVVGILSEGDLMRRVRDEDRPRRSWWLDLVSGPVNAARDFVLENSRRVEDVMTRDIVSVGQDDSVGAIARLLERNRIKRVPVVDNGQLVGIVSRANLLHALSAASEAALPQPSEDDAALRARIGAALKEVPGATVNLVNYTVEDGNVAIWGVADSEFEENAIRVAVENVPGVRAVELHMGRMPSWGYGI